MAKIDEIKEHVGALKTYLTLIVAIILGIGAGVCKLYLDADFNVLFWIGGIILCLCILLFVVIANYMHKNIKKLEEL